MSLPEAAIIIPHYNDVIRLQRCLTALIPQLSPHVELIVVDNGSSDSLQPIHSAFPDLHLVTEPRKGAAAARNRGVAETTAPRLFFLDCDCVPASDWVQVALELADRADLVGGAISLFDETAPPRSGAQAFEAVFAFNNRKYIEKKGFSVTANLLTRRDIFMAVGDFIPGVSEDLEWCHRARAAGYGLIYCDRLKVAHPSRSDWPALQHKWKRVTRELFAVEMQKPAPRLRWVLRAAAMGPSILVHAPRILRSPHLDGAGERLRAVATLTRLRLSRTGWMLKQAMGRGI